MTTRTGLLAGLVSVSALLAACGTTAPEQSAGLAPSAEPKDVAQTVLDQDPVVRQAVPTGQAVAERRVAVNAPKSTAQAEAEASNRVIVSAARNAKRTGNLDPYIKALSDASCPAGTAVRAADAISITAMPTALQPSDPAKRKIGSLTYVAGYQLSSTDARFGGLSGIEVLDNGDLLAVSDAGYFVWMDLEDDGLTPMTARLSTMRDITGQALTGVAGDSAEGLAINGGMALVSFEGNHRVLAFDIGKCGAAARGAPIVFGNYGLPLREAYEDARISVDPGNGSEPLAVTKDWFLFTGIEKKLGHLNSLSARPIESEPEFDLLVGVDAPEFAGIDILPDQQGNGAVRTFLIHRSRDAKDGRVWVTETDLQRHEDRTRDYGPVRGEMDARSRQRYTETGWRELAQLNQFGVVDQFEGIAARQMSDGRVRLYLISDDDYSADKRTVMMVFDLAKPLR